MSKELKPYVAPQSGEIISPDKKLVQCDKHGKYNCEGCSVFVYPRVYINIETSVSGPMHDLQEAIAAHLQVPKHMLFNDGWQAGKSTTIAALCSEIYKKTEDE